MQEQPSKSQGTLDRPDFDYYVKLVDEPEYLAYETQEGRFGIDWPSENTGKPVRIGDPTLSRGAVIEALHEEALRKDHLRSMNSQCSHCRALETQHYSEPERQTERRPRSFGQRRERYWSIEQSAEAVSGLIGSDEHLRHVVYALADGAPGVIRAIKERLADEVSYDPGERLTPERIRSIVGAPEDAALLDSWRDDFYAPYRDKYRAQDHHDNQ